MREPVMLNIDISVTAVPEVERCTIARDATVLDQGRRRAFSGAVNLSEAA